MKPNVIISHRFQYYIVISRQSRPQTIRTILDELQPISSQRLYYYSILLLSLLLLLYSVRYSISALRIFLTVSNNFVRYLYYAVSLQWSGFPVPEQTSPRIVLMTKELLYLHLRLSLASDLFPSVSPTKFSTHLSNPLCVTRALHF